MNEHGILPIDLVAVNLYPFEATVAKEGCSLEDAIENIDIGGPTMIRSSAKNYPDVTVIVDPGDYDAVLAELKQKGEVSIETNFRLAKKVFQHTARYDGPFRTTSARSREEIRSTSFRRPSPSR